MKKELKRILSMLLAAAMLAGLTACGGNDQGGAGDSGNAAGSGDSGNTAADSSGPSEREFQASGEVMNVGVQSNIISIPTVYAYEKGYYEELGLNVNLVMFPNGSPENEGLAAEQLDVASNGLASVYSMASGLCYWIGESDSGSITAEVYVREGSPVLDHKGEIDGKPEMYGSADTLSGLRVLGPTSTMEQWIAASYFSQFGLEAGVDYEYLNMDRAAAAQAILTGEGDVFVATDVDYAKMMQEGGMVKVATCMEATDTSFNNGFLVRKEFLDERYDDVVLFLRAMYRAAEEIESDHALRNEFAYKFYSENGKPADEEDVALETEVRPFVVPADMEADDFYLGSGTLQVGQFFASIGTIEEEQIAFLEEAINPAPLQDALGITVKGATLE